MVVSNFSTAPTADASTPTSAGIAAGGQMSDASPLIAAPSATSARSSTLAHGLPVFGGAASTAFCTIRLPASRSMNQRVTWVPSEWETMCSVFLCPGPSPTAFSCSFSLSAVSSTGVLRLS